jgi:hypothetical protein
MQRRDADRERAPEVWYLVPVPPANVAMSVASFRRWNYVIISILGLLVLGLFMLALVPAQVNKGSAAAQSPATAHKTLRPAKTAAPGTPEHLPI